MAATACQVTVLYYGIPGADVLHVEVWNRRRPGTDRASWRQDGKPNGVLLLPLLDGGGAAASPSTTADAATMLAVTLNSV